MDKRAISGYSVRLRVAYKRDGRHWTAAAPALGLVTQDTAKKAALAGLGEAVGWLNPASRGACSTLRCMSSGSSNGCR